MRGNTNAGAIFSQRLYDSPSPETDLAFEVEPVVECCIDSTRKLFASRTPVRMASIFDGRDQDREQIGQTRETEGGSVSRTGEERVEETGKYTDNIHGDTFGT